MSLIEASEQTSGGEPLLSLRLLAGLLPEFGGELECGVLRPARQERQDVAQVRPGLDVVQLAAGDETGGDRVPFSAVVAPGEAPVRPSDHLPAQFELREIVDETQSTVLETATLAG